VLAYLGPGSQEYVCLVAFAPRGSICFQTDNVYGGLPARLCGKQWAEQKGSAHHQHHKHTRMQPVCIRCSTMHIRIGLAHQHMGK
jgi:hypothetical protein